MSRKKTHKPRHIRTEIFTYNGKMDPNHFFDWLT